MKIRLIAILGVFAVTVSLCHWIEGKPALAWMTAPDAPLAEAQGRAETAASEIAARAVEEFWRDAKLKLEERDRAGVYKVNWTACGDTLAQVEDLAQDRASEYRSGLRKAAQK